MKNLVEDVLSGLMRRYRSRVPEVGGIVQAMIADGVIEKEEEIENDHIAFRTLGVPFLGIASLEKVFLQLGWVRRDAYHFPAKKLDAYWYAPPEPRFPRIFLSELRVDDLSSGTQELIRRYTGGLSHDPVDAVDLGDAKAIDHFLHSSSWELPGLDDYEALQAESEYAAWVIYNRYYLNHFTISVHNLKTGYNTVALFNEFLQRHGFRLNDSGGKIKTSPDGLLLQSSTVAGMVQAAFAGGVKKMIPGSYVEFAERRVLPEFAGWPADRIGREQRREGFEAGNADKIFESTFVSQTGRG